MKDNRFTLSRVFSFLVCTTFLALALPGGAQPAGAQQIPSMPASTSPTETYAPDQLLLRFQPGVSGQRADEILAQRGLSRLRRIQALDIDVLQLPPGLSVERAVAIFSRHPEVEFAEPNYILQALEIADQWGLEKVRAEEAWPLLGTDPPPTLLATVDTGIDRNHTDLSANIWTHSDETAGNGIDDDSNGYIDDTWGWDFVNGDNDPMDDMMHGTAVSSVSAGVRNGSGVAGVCPWCRLMSVKVLNALGSGYLDTVAQGIIYAADNGARVINLSLGATTGAVTLEQAVTHAWQQGAIVVAAAGNNGLEQLFYPAAYTHAMAVGSTNEDDYRSCFSNYSEDFITVTAPGEAILAATPNQGYGTYSGTSLAAPHVTGLAGLLFSQVPTRTNDLVWTLIEQSAVDLGPVGKDGYFGWGRVDAYRAVSGDTSPTTPPQALFTDDPTATGYAHARKVARDRNGRLHWVWHSQEAGQYQVLYATSSDGGQTWTPPEVVFSSSAETYHPALAVDDAYVYIAFPSKHGSTMYRIFFSRKDLDSGTWPESPPAVLGGAYDAVRPDLHAGPSEGELHLVASSFDNAPNVYYIRSDDGGASWGDPKEISVEYNSRYADVYASGSGVYIAGRTVEFTFFGLLPRYRLFTVSSTDGGDNWGNPTELEVYDGWLSGEYGVSLAGVEGQLYLAYEHAGSIYFRRSSDGLNWTLPDPLGAGAWPTLTEAGDGQAWAMWDRSSAIIMRHYADSAWEAEQVLGTGTYPNLKAGISGNLLEWVVTRCGAPYCMTFASQSLGDNDPPMANDVGDFTDEDTADDWSPNVSDPNGDMLTCSAPSGSAFDGQVTVSTDCSGGTYTPALDFFGTDTFTYSACDPGGLCDSGTVTYQVNPVNDPPVASFTFACSVLTCLFDASGSSDPDGTDVSYGWDFGDSNTSSDVMNPSHTYAKAGTYHVVLTIIDSDGAPDTDAQDVTVSGPVTVHVGDLDGTSVDAPRARWEATVTITVHDSNEVAISGASVEGNWSDGATGGASCITDGSGQCSVSKGNLKANVASVTFSVSNVTSSAGAYATGNNHDPDMDSDGTTIIVNKPGANTPPEVSITAPADGADFASDGPINFVGTASDAEDGDLTAKLVWTSDIDGQIGTGGSLSAMLSDGVHTITATATDSAGASGSGSTSITVGTPPSIHVGDLDGSAEVLPGGKWNATVYVLVHDADEGAVAGATVSGDWGGGSGGSGSCTTGPDGWCSITLENISKKASSVSFTVLAISLVGNEYAPSDNHDPDEDSLGGSAITIQPN